MLNLVTQNSLHKFICYKYLTFSGNKKYEQKIVRVYVVSLIKHHSNNLALPYHSVCRQGSFSTVNLTAHFEFDFDFALT